MKRMTKRILSLGTALLLALALAACGGGDGGARRIDSGDSAVVDEAGVLSADTENYVTNLSVALQESCGAQIGVYTVDYIGNTTMEGYAYQVFNDWGLGDADKDNGVLLLLAVGEDDYWMTPGDGLKNALSSSTVSSLLAQQLEPSWVQGDYDTGTRATVRSVTEALCRFYGLTMDIDTVATGTAAAGSAPAAQRGGVSLLTVLLIVGAILLVIWLIGTLSRSGRRRPPPPPPPAGYGGGYGYRSRSSFSDGFASGVGFGIGQGIGRGLTGRRRRTPPPPPPPRPPQPGPGPGFGGFGGMGSPGPAPHRSGGSGGFRAGGGAARGGGVGRSGGIGRSGGSFRAGGGGTRGGGAGRRH